MFHEPSRRRRRVGQAAPGKAAEAGWSSQVSVDDAAFIDLHEPPHLGDNASDHVLTSILTSTRSCLQFCGLTLAAYALMVAALYGVAPFLAGGSPKSDIYRDGFRWASFFWAGALVPPILYILFATPSKKQRLSYVVLSLFAMVLLTYSVKGSSFVPVYLDVFGHELFPVQYVEWACTTPMMLLLLFNLDKRPLRNLVALLTEDVLMVLTGFLASASPSLLWTGFLLLASCLLGCRVLRSVHSMCAEYRQRVRGFPRIGRSIVFLEFVVTATYFAMPLIWALAAAEALEPETAEAAYFFSETAGKLMYSGVLLIINFEIIEYHDRLIAEKEEAALKARLAEQDARRQVEDEQRKRVDERHELTRRYNQRMKEFLQYILHEVRVPLNSLVLTLETIRNESPLLHPRSLGSAGAATSPAVSPQTHNRVLLQQVLDIDRRLHARDSASVDMWREVQRLNAVIGSVLSFQQFNENQVLLESAPTSLQRVCERAVDAVQADAERAQLTVASSLDRSLPLVLTDAARLQQMLQILLTNAITFTPAAPGRRNSVSLTLSRCAALSDTSPLVSDQLPALESEPRAEPQVAPRAESQTVTVRVSVRDSGVGLTTADLENIYLPFLHIFAGEGQKSKTTGMSLVLLRCLVDLMGGRVGVFSREDAGSEFFFELPLQVVPAHAAPAVARSPTTRGGELRLLRVLLIEDSEANRKLLSRLLSLKTGALVDGAVNGQHGVDRMRENLAEASAGTGLPYDLVLCDKEMPVKDGYAAVRELRGMGVACPVIGVTANALLDDQREFLACGLDDIVLKPVNMALLLQVIKRALDKRAAGEVR